VVPEDSDAGAVLWARSQVFEYWLLRGGVLCCEAELERADGRLLTGCSAVRGE
jgi:hypothetical protein